jgi:hypothetical protein
MALALRRVAGRCRELHDLAALLARRVTWEIRKRAHIEMREFEGKQVQHVIGWQGVRKECGCYWLEGLRLDVREPTFGAGACERHEAQLRRAMDTLRHMPPTARPMYELLQEQVDHEIRLSPS